MNWTLNAGGYLLAVHVGNDHNWDYVPTAKSLSLGNNGLASTCAKGPSDSVSNRSRGIFFANDRPFSLLKHCRANAEPAPQINSALKLTLSTRKPMQDRRPCIRCFSKAIEYSWSCAATVDRHYSPARAFAGCQNMIKDSNLIGPVS